MGQAGLGGEASAGSSSGHTARMRVPERASIRSFAWSAASPPGGASATALAAVSSGSRTTTAIRTLGRFPTG